MTKERWQEIFGDIKDKFEVIDNGNEHIEEEGGVDIEYIVFRGPMGKTRLEFIAKPIVLDKKTNYSRRAGSEVKVDYVYSKTEKNHSLNAYKWDDKEKEWEEIDFNFQ